ncbi:MAG: hypothetical protein ACI4WS_09450 [Oscillospiraceae bacterium]
MKQEEISETLISDEELTSISGGVNSIDRLEYRFTPGNRVKCSVPGQTSFEGEIVSTDYVIDRIDREYFPAYLVRPDGGSHDVKVSECFMTLIG